MKRRDCAAAFWISLSCLANAQTATSANVQAKVNVPDVFRSFSAEQRVAVCYRLFETAANQHLEAAASLSADDEARKARESAHISAMSMLVLESAVHRDILEDKQVIDASRLKKGRLDTLRYCREMSAKALALKEVSDPSYLQAVYNAAKRRVHEALEEVSPE